MQREICDLVNRRFYDGTLVSSPTIEQRSRLPPIIGSTGIPQLDDILNPDIAIAVVDVEGIEEYRGVTTFNRLNLAVDSLLVQSLRSSGLAANKIGLITPYKEQQRRLVASVGREADIGTVDSFQGQERDIVILDLVRANPDRNVGFTLDPNRLNVALSRAREKLIIITNLPTFRGHEAFNSTIDLIDSLPHTCTVHVSAKQLGTTLPEYRRRPDIEIDPRMVDNVEEPEEQPPTTSSPPAGDYSDIY
jgi:superfamily I DNA and/or RNA helicase